MTIECKVSMQMSAQIDIMRCTDRELELLFAEIRNCRAFMAPNIESESLPRPATVPVAGPSEDAYEIARTNCRFHPMAKMNRYGQCGQCRAKQKYEEKKKRMKAAPSGKRHSEPESDTHECNGCLAPFASRVKLAHHQAACEPFLRKNGFEHLIVR